MKALFFLLPLILVNACKTQSDNVDTSENTVMEQIQKLDNGCPEAGNCTVEILKNKTLLVKEDGTGAMYPQMEDGKNTVVVYTYFNKGPEGTADGNYSETIHFEIPAGTTKLAKVDASLKDVKLLFGKHCYCKGEAGYYTVESGKLSIDKTNDSMKLDLLFRIDKTSHRVSNITGTLRM